MERLRKMQKSEIQNNVLLVIIEKTRMMSTRHSSHLKGLRAVQCFTEKKEHWSEREKWNEAETRNS